MEGIQSLTSAQLHAELKARPGLVLVDFWAPWCAPCRRLVPTLEHFAKEFHDRVGVLKVDISEEPGVAAEYSIQSIPSLLLFKDGALISRKMGVCSLAELEQFVFGAALK